MSLQFDENTNGDFEDQLARLQARERLRVETDQELERCIQERLPLEETLQLVLPVLGAHTNAAGLWIHTFDEELEMRTFEWVLDPDSELERVVRDLLAGPTEEKTVRLENGGALIRHQLDVAGEDFGCIVSAVAKPLESNEIEHLRRMVDDWCEQVDNHLAAIARSRKKHLITQAVSEVLRHPVLDKGVDKAITILREHVPFDDLILIYHQDDDRHGDTLNYKLVRSGNVIQDNHPEWEAFESCVRSTWQTVFSSNAGELARRFGISGYREEVLISGSRKKRVVGRVVIGSQHQTFSTFDRDLLERFADCLRQRIVDYNHQWRSLAMCFPNNVVKRLLSDEEHTEKFLAPRVAPVAILFADMSGFSKICDQVVKEPVLIGELIHRWSVGVVDLIWSIGGTFDKMVGDCVIGLWGPPFYEMEPQELCRRALLAATKIRTFTESANWLEDHAALSAMELDLGVSVGLNYADVFVGPFGPSGDYTAFGTEMNNAARLQGLATRNEILCMDSLVAEHGAPTLFGPPCSANVKNVAAPLTYHRLIGTP